MGSPAVGQAKFKGRFDWTPDGSTSNGVITIPRLDFQSPAGPVQGLKGELTFSSLAPLVAAPGQALEIDKVEAKAGDSIALTPLLLVDGDKMTSDAKALGKASVTAEVIAETKGPKIKIIKFKNKTGYKKRQGHRQRYTQVKVTGIKG